MSSFIKDLISVGLSRFGVIAFGLARTIITARYLGPEGNGVIAALIVFPNLFMTFGSLGIRQSTTYYIGKAEFSEDAIKRSIAQIWSFTTVLSVILSFVLIRYFSNSGDNLLLVFLAIVPIPFTLFNTYNSGIFLGKNQISAFNKINWLPFAISFIATVLLVVLLGLGVPGALIAVATGAFFMFFILLFKNDFIKSFTFSFDWKIIKSLLSLGIVYAISLLVINLNYKVDVIILDKLSNTYELGIYTKGAELTEYLWQIPMLLSTIVFARSAIAKDNIVFSRKVAQLLRVSVLIVGCGAFFLVAISEQLILLMYGEAFFGSILVLQWLLPGVFLLTIFKVLNMDLAGKGKPWVSLKAMSPAIVINVVLNLLLVEEYGAKGAAFASTISYSFAAILFLYFYSKETGLPIKEILNYSKRDFDEIINPVKKIMSK
jgi:O-antigen/teichoic acid export membrane protein